MERDAPQSRHLRLGLVSETVYSGDVVDLDHGHNLYRVITAKRA
jgi:hypothetical protein